MANIITIFRFLLIVPLTIFILNSNTIGATVVFVLAAATDWLDGYVARRTKITDFGKIADPLADRLLIIVTIVLLTSTHRISYIAATFLVGRDLTLLAGALLLKVRGIKFEVIKAGKYATAFVMLSILLILMNIPYSLILFYLSVIFYCVVGIIYTQKATSLLTKKGEK